MERIHFPTQSFYRRYCHNYHLQKDLLVVAADQVTASFLNIIADFDNSLFCSVTFLRQNFNFVSFLFSGVSLTSVSSAQNLSFQSQTSPSQEVYSYETKKGKKIE